MFFSWKQVDGAVRYELWVTNTTLNTTPINLTNLMTHSYTPATALSKGNYRAWVRTVSSTGEIAIWSVQAQFTIALLESDSAFEGDDSPFEMSLASLPEAELPTDVWPLRPENENFRPDPVSENSDVAAEVKHPVNDLPTPEHITRPYRVSKFAFPADTATEQSEIENLDESLVDLLMTRLHFQAID